MESLEKGLIKYIWVSAFSLHTLYPHRNLNNFHEPSFSLVEKLETAKKSMSRKYSLLLLFFVSYTKRIKFC